MRSILEKALIALLNEDKKQAEQLFESFISQRASEFNKAQGINEGDEYTHEIDGSDCNGSDESCAKAAAAGEAAAEDHQNYNPYEMDSPEWHAFDNAYRDNATDGDGELEESNEDESGQVMESDSNMFTATPEELSGLLSVRGVDDADRVVEGLQAGDSADNLPIPVTGRADNGDFILGITYDEVDAMIKEIAEEQAGDDYNNASMFGFDTHCYGVYENYWNESKEDEDGGDMHESSFSSDLEEAYKQAQVSVASGDGREQGDAKFKQNTKSPVIQGKADMSKAKPVQTKTTAKSGFDSEKAPTVKPMAKRSNTESKAAAGQSAVKKPK